MKLIVFFTNHKMNKILVFDIYTTANASCANLRTPPSYEHDCNKEKNALKLECCLMKNGITDT